MRVFLDFEEVLENNEMPSLLSFKFLFDFHIFIEVFTRFFRRNIAKQQKLSLEEAKLTQCLETSSVLPGYFV